MTDQTKALEQGDQTPDFILKTNGGGEISLQDLQGNPVVVYFYPKDNTPGCTTEALDFSARADDFAKLNTKVIGISPDSVKKHDNFIAKHQLSVLLAADTEKTVCEAFGVWVEKKMYGKTYMGVERSTFLIDQTGKIAQIWRKVKVKDHAQAILNAVQELNDS